MFNMNDSNKGAPVWLISFTDLMALMLTFFVLIFSMTKPEPKAWEDLRTTFSKEFGTEYGSLGYRAEQEYITLPKVTFNHGDQLEYLSPVLKSQFQENPVLDPIEISNQGDRLLLSLDQSILFDTASAELKPEGKAALKALTPVLSQLSNAIEVAGHADPRAVNENAGWGSNWALSLARAASVAHELYQNGYNREFRVQGFSSTRYQELPETLDEKKRLSLARRIDIIILNNDGSIYEALGFVR